MKRDDLKTLGLTEEQIDKIMALNGQDIEANKAKLTTLQSELDGTKKLVTDANTEIENFKKLDIEGVRKAADEWKAKAEQAEAEAVKQIQMLKFDHALDGALTGAKAKNAKAVKALLEMQNLKLNETDGSIIGLDDQIKKVKETNEYLFDSDEPTPRIVAGANNRQITGDAISLAARRAAGLPDPK
jgi:hypothetical protein